MNLFFFVEIHGMFKNPLVFEKEKKISFVEILVKNARFFA